MNLIGIVSCFEIQHKWTYHFTFHHTRTQRLSCLQCIIKDFNNQNINRPCLPTKKNLYHPPPPPPSPLLREATFIPQQFKEHLYDVPPWAMVLRIMSITYKEATGWMTSYHICANKGHYTWLTLDAQMGFFFPFKSISEWVNPMTWVRTTST